MSASRDLVLGALSLSSLALEDTVHERESMTCFCRVLQPSFLLVCPSQATIAQFLQTVKLVLL